MDYISPIGTLRIEASEKGLKSIRFVSPEDADAGSAAPQSEIGKTSAAMCASALNRYFAKQWGAFEQMRSSIPLDLSGTAFQKKVWGILYSMPNTYPIVGMHYSELAFLAGRPDAVRACANICGQNAISILIPCHRIMPMDGTIGGYAWGTEKKSWLLWHEGASPKNSKASSLLMQPPQTR